MEDPPVYKGGLDLLNQTTLSYHFSQLQPNMFSNDPAFNLSQDSSCQKEMFDCAQYEQEILPITDINEETEEDGDDSACIEMSIDRVESCPEDRTVVPRNDDELHVETKEEYGFDGNDEEFSASCLFEKHKYINPLEIANHNNATIKEEIWINDEEIEESVFPITTLREEEEEWSQRYTETNVKCEEDTSINVENLNGKDVNNMIGDHTYPRVKPPTGQEGLTITPGRDLRYAGMMKCHKCDEYFDDYETLQSHLLQSHNLSYTLRCYFCDQSSSSARKFMEHLLLHDDKLNRMCALCRGLYPRTSFTCPRDQCKRVKREYTCQICMHSFIAMWDLHIHMRQKHPFCHVCLKHVEHNFALEDHMISDHGNKEETCKDHMCPFCKSVFDMKLKKDRHIESAHRKDKISIKKSTEDVKVRPSSSKAVCKMSPSKALEDVKVRPSSSKAVCKMSPSKALVGRKDCDESFSNPDSLDDHISSIQLKCNLCPQTFSTKSELKCHIQVEHILEKMSYNCPICNKVLPSRSKQEEHAESKHFFCEICQAIFSSKNELSAHADMKHVKCEVCNELLFDSAALYLHMETVHFVCRVCNDLFPSQNEYIFHMHKEHVMCIICEEFVANKASLNSHVATHLQSCELCHKTYANQTFLDKHIVENHWVCKRSICKEYFSSAQELNAHKKLHVRCKICQEMFFNAAALRKHMKSKNHGESENIIQPEIALRGKRCQLCGKCFSDETYLCYHVLTDHVQCRICQKYMMNDFMLDMHVKSQHWRCQVPSCREYFPDKKKVEKHIAKKHLTCTICSQNFPSKSAYREHVSDSTCKQMLVNQNDLKTGMSVETCTTSPEHNPGDEDSYSSRITCEYAKQDILCSCGAKCFFCTKSFRTVLQLNSHLGSHSHADGQSEEDVENSCCACKVNAESSLDMDEWECYFCRERFSIRALSSHVQDCFLSSNSMPNTLSHREHAYARTENSSVEIGIERNALDNNITVLKSSEIKFQVHNVVDEHSYSFQKQDTACDEELNSSLEYSNL